MFRHVYASDIAVAEHKGGKSSWDCLIIIWNTEGNVESFRHWM